MRRVKRLNNEMKRERNIKKKCLIWEKNEMVSERVWSGEKSENWKNVKLKLDTWPHVVGVDCINWEISSLLF